MAKRKPTVSTKATAHTGITDLIGAAYQLMAEAENQCRASGDRPKEMTSREFVYGFLLRAAGFSGEDVAKLLYFILHAETAQLAGEKPKKRKRRRK